MWIGHFQLLKPLMILVNFPQCCPFHLHNCCSGKFSSIPLSFGGRARGLQLENEGRKDLLLTGWPNGSFNILVNTSPTIPFIFLGLVLILKLYGVYLLWISVYNCENYTECFRWVHGKVKRLAVMAKKSMHSNWGSICYSSNRSHNKAVLFLLKCSSRHLNLQQIRLN